MTTTTIIRSDPAVTTKRVGIVAVVLAAIAWILHAAADHGAHARCRRS